MKTLETMAGDDIYDTLRSAVESAKDEDVSFEFNDNSFVVMGGEDFNSAKDRWTKQTGIDVLTREESAARAKKYLEEAAAKSEREIAEAGVMTEAQLRDSHVPSPRTLDELTKYINSLVERPHDYGTCVYAMSMSATAAFNYVAHKLGVTGFQASCADMDILRRTRGLKWGKVLDFENLLYPQYCDEAHYPSAKTLIDENKEELAKRAKVLLAENGGKSAHGAVIKHWEYLAALA